MATDRRRSVRRACIVLLCVSTFFYLVPHEADAAAWWSRIALAGTDVTQVRADGTTVIVRTAAGDTLRSTDSAHTFTPVPGNPQVTVPAETRSGDDTWLVTSGGTVLHGRGSSPLAPDPHGPDLGRGNHMLAAPASLPGVVVAVAADGTVWRRGADGGWGRALLLLPAGLVSGVPHITSVAAFTQPITGTVYLSTDGYSVLLSRNGGDDWIRANPGLPDSVAALAADAQGRLLYAATPDGLYAHRLQAFPRPQVYHDAALAWRWLGIALVMLFAAAAAAFMLWRAVMPQPR